MRAAAFLLLFSLACPASAEVRLASGGASEFPQETAALVAATAELFDAAEAAPKSGDRKVPVLGTLPTPVSLTTDEALSALSERGPVSHLTGYRINWYPVERLLGAVDFMGTWDDNRNLVCGYVLWDLSDPDNPSLDHVVANYVEVARLASSGEGAVHEALIEANCAYGDIDLNYTVFD